MWVRLIQGTVSRQAFPSRWSVFVPAMKLSKAQLPQQGADTRKPQWALRNLTLQHSCGAGFYPLFWQWLSQGPLRGSGQRQSQAISGLSSALHQTGSFPERLKRRAGSQSGDYIPVFSFLQSPACTPKVCQSCFELTPSSVEHIFPTELLCPRSETH